MWSINEDGQSDIFSNPKSFNEDYIWPLSKGGSDFEKNKMFLSWKTNQNKTNKTKGTINIIILTVEKALTEVDDNGKQYFYWSIYIE